jgi:large subunit ribosomal protein L5
MNKMEEVMIDKLVLHICAGQMGPRLENAKRVLNILTERKPIETKAKVKLPKWGLRPGLSIGAKVTLRGTGAKDFLKKALTAKSFELNKKSFDKTGNFAFGIKEYIDIEGTKYDPKIGIFGLDVMINLKKRGQRVKDRRLMKNKIGINAKVNKDEAIEFAKTLGVNVV